MNSWRETFLRVLRELWLAVFTQDTQQARRTFWRLLARVGIPRDTVHHLHRDAIAFVFCLLLTLMFAVAALLLLAGSPV